MKPKNLPPLRTINDKIIAELKILAEVRDEKATGLAEVEASIPGKYSGTGGDTFEFDILLTRFEESRQLSAEVKFLDGCIAWLARHLCEASARSPFELEEFLGVMADKLGDGAVLGCINGRIGFKGKTFGGYLAHENQEIPPWLSDEELREHYSPELPVDPCGVTVETLHQRLASAGVVEGSYKILGDGAVQVIKESYGNDNGENPLPLADQ